MSVSHFSFKITIFYPINSQHTCKCISFSNHVNFDNLGAVLRSTFRGVFQRPYIFIYRLPAKKVPAPPPPREFCRHSLS